MNVKNFSKFLEDNYIKKNLLMPLITLANDKTLFYSFRVSSIYGI